MRTGSVWCAAAMAALTVGVLSGCDQRLAVQPARDHQAADETPATALASLGSDNGRAAAADRRSNATANRADAAPTRLVQGKPMWSDNRRHSAQENAQYQFEHHGTELGARDLDDFVVKVHQFVNGSGDGVLSLTRANGDRLMYDPKSKLFGVVRSDGAPRTVFKPQDGRAYWDQQVAAQDEDRPSTTTRRTTAKTGNTDDRS